jgi:hypothetical protein
MNKGEHLRNNKRSAFRLVELLVVIGKNTARVTSHCIGISFIKNMKTLLLSTLLCICQAYAQLENPGESEILRDSPETSDRIRANAFSYAGPDARKF